MVWVLIKDGDNFVLISYTYTSLTRLQETCSCKWAVLHEDKVFSDMRLHVTYPNPHATLYFAERKTDV